MNIIRRLYFIDKKKAKDEAKDFLKDLLISPSREEKYKLELKCLMVEILIQNLILLKALIS